MSFQLYKNELMSRTLSSNGKSSPGNLFLGKKIAEKEQSIELARKNKFIADWSHIKVIAEK